MNYSEFIFSNSTFVHKPKLFFIINSYGAAREDKQVILRSVLENALHQKVHIVEHEEVIYL